MSLGDSTYGVSSVETTDRENGVVAQADAVTTTRPEAAPAEPVASREDDASYMHQGPAADLGDDAGGENRRDEDGAGYYSESGDGDYSWADPAVHTQGMSRTEYATYMHNGLAAGRDGHDTGDDGDDPEGIGLQVGSGPEVREGDPAVHAQGTTRTEYAIDMRNGLAAGVDESTFAGSAVDDGSSEEPETSDAGTEASQLQGTGQMPADLNPAGQATELATRYDASPMPRESANGEAAGAKADAPANLDTRQEQQVAEPVTQVTPPDPATSDSGSLPHDNSESGTDTTYRSVPAQADASQQAPGDQGAPKNDNPDTQIDVVQLTPADRTLGDTTPTGIGLKPTGEQLGQLEDDSKSHLEKLRRNIFDRADDISDAADEHGGTLGHLFERPPTGAYTEVPSTPHHVPDHQEQGVDGGHLASAGLVVGVLGFELFRRVKDRLEAGRN